MALGGLSSKANRGRSTERGSTESVLGAAPGGTTAAPRAEPPKSSTRQSGGRSKGPDAKSVISGLNSSNSSASALLAPMLQGQPKRRSSRPEGADAASVL